VQVKINRRYYILTPPGRKKKPELRQQFRSDLKLGASSIAGLNRRFPDRTGLLLLDRILTPNQTLQMYAKPFTKRFPAPPVGPAPAVGAAASARAGRRAGPHRPG
jgi:hypothetical protein